MKTFVAGILVFVLLAGGIVGGWIALNNYHPGSLGTPANAGAVSNGHPEECTNVDFPVKARGEHSEKVSLDENWIVRGTFGVEGGLGNVDILMRIVDAQGLDMFASPKAANFDFVFPVKLRGDYTFVFDNRYSMYTAKSVGLFYCIDKGRRPDAH